MRNKWLFAALSLLPLPCSAASASIGFIYAVQSQLINEVVVPDTDAQLQQTHFTGPGQQLFLVPTVIYQQDDSTLSLCVNYLLITYGVTIAVPLPVVVQQALP